MSADLSCVICEIECIRRPMGLHVGVQKCIQMHPQSIDIVDPCLFSVGHSCYDFNSAPCKCERKLLPRRAFPKTPPENCRKEYEEFDDLGSGVLPGCDGRRKRIRLRQGRNLMLKTNELKFIF